MNIEIRCRKCDNETRCDHRNPFYYCPFCAKELDPRLYNFVETLKQRQVVESRYLHKTLVLFIITVTLSAVFGFPRLNNHQHMTAQEYHLVAYATFVPIVVAFLALLFVPKLIAKFHYPEEQEIYY